MRLPGSLAPSEAFRTGWHLPCWPVSTPVFGLYAGFAGPIAGGLTASTRLMVITTTTAAALAAGSALTSVEDADKAASLFLIVLFAGAFMVLAGILKLGRYTRFVSHSVMIGFLTGVSANIIFGQLPDLTGVEAEGGSSLAKALDVVLNPGAIDIPSLLAGLGRGRDSRDRRPHPLVFIRLDHRAR